MRPETRRELTGTIRGYLEAGTTALADAVFENPVSVYTSEERAARERERLFDRMPLLLGLSGLAPRPGDFVTDDESSRPVLLVRGPDGRLRGFLNVCRHRGSRVAEGCGEGRKSFVCPYHGWSYDLLGRLAGVPFADGFDGMDRDAHGLRPIPVIERHGLVWVLPPDATESFDIDAHLGGAAADLEAYDLDGFVHYDTRRLLPRLNWKIAVDTFLEAYHLPCLHKATVGPIFLPNLCVSDGFGSNHRMVAVRRSFQEALAAGTSESELADDLLRHTIELYTLFPNAVLVYQVDHVELWRMFQDPRTPDASRVVLSFYVPEPPSTERARKHWEANMDLAMAAVQNEDFRVGEGIQRGFHAGAQEHVTYGRNEPGLIHFHRSLRRALGEPA